MNSPKLQEAGIRAQSFPFQRALSPSLLFSIFILATEPFFQTFYTDKKEKQRIALDEKESGGEARVVPVSTTSHPWRPLRGSYLSSYSTKLCWFFLFWTKKPQKYYRVGHNKMRVLVSTWRRLLLTYVGTGRPWTPQSPNSPARHLLADTNIPQLEHSCAKCKYFQSSKSWSYCQSFAPKEWKFLIARRQKETQRNKGNIVQTGNPGGLKKKKSPFYNVAEIQPSVGSFWPETFLLIRTGEILSEQRQLKAQTSWTKHLLGLSYRALNSKQCVCPDFRIWYGTRGHLTAL